MIQTYGSHFVSGGSVGSTFTTPPIPLDLYNGFYIEATITAGSSPAGTFKLQSSASGGPTTYVDVTSTSQVVSGNGTVSWNVTGAQYRFVQVVYTRTSGSGTLDCWFNGKG